MVASRPTAGDDVAETIEIPKIGSVKRQHLYIVGGVAGGVVVYAWWRARSAPADGTAEEELPPEDPFQGMTDSGGGGSVTGYGGGGSDTQQTGPRTNAEWTMLATERLLGSYEMQAITDALGSYINRKPLTATEQRIVQAAIAVAGYPPEGSFTIIGVGPETGVSDAPTGIAVRSVLEDAFTVTWNATPGAVRYKVYEGSKLVITKASTFYAATGKKPATKYGPIVVSGVSAAGVEGPKSLPIFVTTMGNPPINSAKPLAAPGNIRATDVTTTQIDIVWNHVPGAARYDFWVDGKRKAYTPNTYYTVSGLRKNTSHRFQVRAIDASGKPGPNSKMIRVRTRK